MRGPIDRTTAMNAIQSRVPMSEYASLQDVSITRLKELKRSPQHYRYRLDHPKSSAAMTLGTAAHCAVLEPERFATDFAVWGRRTDSGRLAPRNGKAWEEFQDSNRAREIITADDYELAVAMRNAVRGDASASKYLESGDPEVVLRWEMNGHACRGRVDWLTHIDGEPIIVGLKTARDCRHFVFSSAAAKLGYHLQWAFYHDGYEIIAGKDARVVEIVVESEPPHAVATYAIPNDIMEQGRSEYQDLLKLLSECQASGEWPGPVTNEEFLTLPSWVYERQEDISDLGLEE